MSIERQLKLAKSRTGRTLLHLACLVHGHLAWHLLGIWREVCHV